MRNPRNAYWIAPLLLMASLASCGQHAERTTALEHRVDSLQEQVAKSYRPGFGEFMSGIQAHHVKLWSAGTHANWELADFEIHEMEELVDDIKTYASGRKETALIGMLDPALDSIDTAIAKEDTALFRSSYLLLTNTCNSCHQATDHGFIVITVPTSQPFSAQDFAPRK